MTTAEILLWCLLGFAGAVACFIFALLAAMWLAGRIADEYQQERQQARHAEWTERQDGEG